MLSRDATSPGYCIEIEAELLRLHDRITIPDHDALPAMAVMGMVSGVNVAMDAVRCIHLLNTT